MESDYSDWEKLLELLDDHLDDEEERLIDLTGLEEEWNEESPFVRWYKNRKPKGTKESWLEDIGFPVFVLEEVWKETKARSAGFKRKELLWLLSWLRKHNTFRSMAAEWNTSKSTFERKVKALLIFMVGKLGFVR